MQLIHSCGLSHSKANIHLQQPTAVTQAAFFHPAALSWFQLNGPFIQNIHTLPIVPLVLRRRLYSETGTLLLRQILKWVRRTSYLRANPNKVELLIGKADRQGCEIKAEVPISIIRMNCAFHRLRFKISVVAFQRIFIQHFPPPSQESLQFTKLKELKNQFSAVLVDTLQNNGKMIYLSIWPINSPSN